MSDFNAFTKIWALGHRNIISIWDYDVEVTEKIDGSQFGVTNTSNGLVVRSKGVVIDQDNVPNLFSPVVEYFQSIQHKLPIGIKFYGETLNKPKHNTLAYDRTPKNNFILFGVDDDIQGSWCEHDGLTIWAEKLDVEVIPLVYKGKANFEKIKELVSEVSVLGGTQAEGVVVKVYRNYLAGNLEFPLMAGKYVTEKFKEVHQKNPTFHSGKTKTEELFQKYNTTARFQKGVQHLRDSGELLGEPKDIGALMKEVNHDLIAECEDEIKEALWGIYRKDFLKVSSRGLAQWYKDQLGSGNINI